MDVVIIAKLDRLTRSVADLAELLEAFQAARRIAGERGGFARHAERGRTAGIEHHGQREPVGEGSAESGRGTR